MPSKFESHLGGRNFAVRADSREEVIRLIQAHAEAEHGLSLGEEDIAPGSRTPTRTTTE